MCLSWLCPRESLYSPNRRSKPFIPFPADLDVVQTQALELSPKQRVQLSSPVAAIPHAIRDPWNVRHEQEIQLPRSGLCLALDPCRRSAEIMLAIHDGAHEIRIENEQVARARDRRVFGRHLSARDRPVIAEAHLPAPLRRVCPHELRRDRSAEMLAEAVRKLRLPRRFSAGEDDFDQAGAGSTPSAPRSRA